MAALGSLPPWVSVTPHDFLLATQAGAQLGHTISEASQRAFENQQRMQMESKHQEQVQAQQAIENAMTRLAADRLENYRQQESANRQAQLGIEQKRLGSLDIQQQRADDLKAHYADMAAAKLKADQQGKNYGEPVYADVPGVAGAKVAYRPGSPGMHLVLPPRTPNQGNDLQRQRLQLSALNAMAPRAGETEDMPSYQSRTNAVGGLLRSLNPGSPMDVPAAPKDPKERKANTTYKTPKGLFTWTGSGWSGVAQSPATQQEPDDAE